MDVGADLRARPDRGPGVDHRPWPHPGADVDVAGHQHAALGEEGAVARHTGRHDPDTAVGVVGLDGDLVEEVQPADVHRLNLADPEVEQDRLLHPLVHEPPVTGRLRDANRSRVEQADHLLDHGRVERTGLPHLLDLLRELHCS